MSYSIEYSHHTNHESGFHDFDFPTTITQLEEAIRYWQGLRDFINPPSSSHDVWSGAIGEILNVLETISSLPPRSDQRERYSRALVAFERVQYDGNYGVEEEPSLQTTPPVFSQSHMPFEEWNYIVEQSWDHHVTRAAQPNHSCTYHRSSPSSSPSTPSTSPRNSSNSPYEGGEFSCPDCSQVFARTNALARHINSIHQCPGVACPFCEKEKTYNRSDNFQRHVAKAHENIADDNEVFVKCVQRLYQGGANRKMSWRRT